MTGHSLKRTGDVNQAPDGIVPLIKLPQRSGKLQHFIDRHIKSCRNLFGHLVGIGIADFQYAPDVSDGHPGSHSPESYNLRNMVIAV